MKLRNAYLQAFGKFIDTNFAFNNGINVIYGDNEAGKSTLAEFIFNMFYGQKRYGMKRRIYSQAHDNNKPWHHPLYQGVLQYTLKDQEYRIERNFHSELEEVKMYSDRTGEEMTHCFKYDTRKELQFLNAQIGINERIFKNTVYISQSQIEGQLNKNKEKVLEEILGKTIYGVESEEGEKTIIESINELKKIKREIGTENNKNKPLASAYTEIRDKLAIKYQLENGQKRYREHQKLLEEVNSSIKELLEKEEKLILQKRSIENKYIEDKIKLIESFISEKQDLIDYMERNFTESIEEVSVDHINQQRKENQKIIKKTSYWMFTMLAVVLMIAAWFMISPRIPLQASIFIVSAFASIFNIVRWKKARKKKTSLFQQLEKANQHQDAIYELKYLQDKIEVESKEYSLEQLKAKIHPLESNFDFSKDNPTKYEIEIELEKKEEDYRSLMNKKVAYETRIQENNWNPLELQEIEKEIYHLQKFIENLEEDIQAIDIAMDTLNEIEQNKKSKWLPEIVKTTQEYIYKITKKYHSIKIDDEYQIKTLEPDTQKLIAIDQLSKGTFNQFYFALRMSMIQVLSPSPIQLPIILDEPFVNFDKSRLEESMKLLKELSKKHQIIIFSSQIREKNYLDKMKCDYNFIEL